MGGAGLRSLAPTAGPVFADPTGSSATTSSPGSRTTLRWPTLPAAPKRHADAAEVLFYFLAAAFRALRIQAALHFRHTGAHVEQLTASFTSKSVGHACTSPGVDSTLGLLLPCCPDKSRAVRFIGGLQVSNITSLFWFFLSIALLSFLCSSTYASSTPFTKLASRSSRLQVLEVMPPTVDTELTRHANGPKIQPEVVAKLSSRPCEVEQGELRVGHAAS